MAARLCYKPLDHLPSIRTTRRPGDRVRNAAPFPAESPRRSTRPPADPSTGPSVRRGTTGWRRTRPGSEAASPGHCNYIITNHKGHRRIILNQITETPPASRTAAVRPIEVGANASAATGRPCTSGRGCEGVCHGRNDPVPESQVSQGPTGPGGGARQAGQVRILRLGAARPGSSEKARGYDRLLRKNRVTIQSTTSADFGRRLRRVRGQSRGAAGAEISTFHVFFLLNPAHALVEYRPHIHRSDSSGPRAAGRPTAGGDERTPHPSHLFYATS